MNKVRATQIGFGLAAGSYLLPWINFSFFDFSEGVKGLTLIDAGDTLVQIGVILALVAVVYGLIMSLSSPGRFLGGRAAGTSLVGLVGMGMVCFRIVSAEDIFGAAELGIGLIAGLVALGWVTVANWPAGGLSGVFASWGMGGGAPHQAPPLGGNAVLHFLSGPLAGQQVRLPAGGQLRVGRSAGQNHVVLNDGSVSGSHAVLASLGGAFSVQDLGSTNGTFVNNRRIGSAVHVNNGDRIRFGDSEAQLIFV